MKDALKTFVGLNEEDDTDLHALQAVTAVLMVMGGIVVLRQVARKIAKNDIKSHQEAGRYAR